MKNLTRFLDSDMFIPLTIIDNTLKIKALKLYLKQNMIHKTIFKKYANDNVIS